MSIFPFTVIFLTTADEIRILVVKHDSKKPGFGGERS